MLWLGIWFGIPNTCGGAWWNGLGQNRETDEEHDEDCVEDRCQMASVKDDRHGERDRKALGMGNCCINI